MVSNIFVMQYRARGNQGLNDINDPRGSIYKVNLIVFRELRIQVFNYYTNAFSVCPPESLQSSSKMKMKMFGLIT